MYKKHKASNERVPYLKGVGCVVLRLGEAKDLGGELRKAIYKKVPNDIHLFEFYLICPLFPFKT